MISEFAHRTCPVSWDESQLLEPRKCPSCPGLNADTGPQIYCFKCLEPDHTADNKATRGRQQHLLSACFLSIVWNHGPDFGPLWFIFSDDHHGDHAVEFYRLSKPLKPAYVLPTLLKYGSVLRHCEVNPLKRKVHVTGLMDFLQVQGRTETTCPGMAPVGCEEIVNRKGLFSWFCHATERWFYSTYFMVPYDTRDFIPILDLNYLNTCIAYKPFHKLNIKQLLELVQPPWT